MPIDPFAALNAMLRAEAARADAYEGRPRPAGKDTESATADRGSTGGDPDESRTPR